MATHSSILAWKIPRTGKPGGLQSMGLQRVGHDWMTKPPHIIHTHTHTHTRAMHVYICIVLQLQKYIPGQVLWKQMLRLFGLKDVYQGSTPVKGKKQPYFSEGKVNLECRPPSTQRSTQEWVLLVRVLWHQLERIDVLGLLEPWVAQSLDEDCPREGMISGEVTL